MTLEEFKNIARMLIAHAESRLDDDLNVLDLRAGRFPYDTTEDLAIFCTHDLEDAYNFVKDAEEWYVDIYENFHGKNMAEYVNLSVVSWM